MKTAPVRAAGVLGATLLLGCSPPALPQHAKAAPAPQLAAAKPKRAPGPPDDPAFGPSNPATIALGPTFACAIRADARVACWGSNAEGELGQADAEPREGPVVVAGLEGAVEIAAGEHHACARRNDGTVSCWGQGAAFRLGRKLADGPSGAQVVPEVAHAVAIAAGKEHSCAALADGSLRCWGSPEHGMLGLDHLDHVTEPTNVALDALRVTGVALGDDTTCVRDGAGRVHCWGIGEDVVANERHTIEGVEGATELVAGAYQMCARTKAGALLCWSSNGKAARDEELPEGVTLLALGSSFGCGRVGADLTCWGFGGPRRVEGAMPMLEPSIYPEVAGATELRARGDFVCARAGGIWCWGDNAHGQIGKNPGGVYRPVEVPFAGHATALVVSGTSSCAVGNDGKLRCWGDGPRASHKKKIEELEQVTAAALGPHACAVHGGGKVACWGDVAGNGELGKSVPRPAPKPARGPAQGLAALSMSDLGMAGLLGSAAEDFVGEVEGVSGATAVAVRSGASCALTPSGAWCWGDDGSTAAPSKIARADRFGSGTLAGGWGEGSRDVPCSMLSHDEARCTAAKKPRLVPDTQGARAIAASSWGFCVLQSDDHVSCFSGSKPMPVADVSDVVALRGSADEMCAIDKSGVDLCWNEERRAQRHPLFTEALRDAGTTGDYACGVTATGGVQCYGSDAHGQLGDGRRGDGAEAPVAVRGIAGAVSVGLGERHACALLGDGTVRCWGAGDAQMARPATALPHATEPVRVELEPAH